MNLAKKIKAIRLAEGLQREEMAELVDIPKNSLRNYEQGASIPQLSALVKIVNHDRFKKYLFWLMIEKDEQVLESSQVRPPAQILKQFEPRKDTEEIGKKIKAIRLAEGLEVDAFSTLLGLKKKHLYLIEKCEEQPSYELLSMINNHAQFRKYTLWLHSGDVIPDGGQISPSTEILNFCKLKVK